MSNTLKALIAAIALVGAHAQAVTPDEAKVKVATTATCHAVYSASLMYYSFSYGAMAALGETSAAKQSGEIADIIIRNQKGLAEYRQKELVALVKESGLDPKEADAVYATIVKDATNEFVDTAIKSIDDAEAQIKHASKLTNMMKGCAVFMRNELGLKKPQPKAKTVDA